MRKYLTALLLVGPILFISIICCTPSLHPLYTEEDLVFDPALLGVWTDVDEDGDALETYEFLEQSRITTDPETGAEQQAQFYKMRYISEGKIARFNAHLVTLADELFLDLYPTDLNSYEMADWYQGHLIQAHTFLYVKQIEPHITMGYFDSEWLRQYLADNPQAVGHDYLREEGEGLLFTAPTVDLQAFMLECLEQEGALTDENLESTLFDLLPMDASELASLTVNVTRDGAPVGLGTVDIYDSGNVLYRQEEVEHTGNCQFANLVPGSYSVCTSDSFGEELFNASQDITLAAGDSLHVELELVKAGDS